MNGDLISRSALLEALKKSREHHAESGRDLSLLCRCENIVREQPTAYNVDKVVEQLEEKALEHSIDAQQFEEDGWCNHASKQYAISCAYEYAIEIVKVGGVE